METMENEKKQYIYITACSRVNMYHVKHIHPELAQYCTNNPCLFDIRILEQRFKNDKTIIRIDDR
jgi:hypothetical protein